MKASLLHVSKSVIPGFWCISFKGQQNFLPATARAGFSSWSWTNGEPQSRPEGRFGITNTLRHGKPTGTYGRKYPTSTHVTIGSRFGVRHASSASTTTETSGTAKDAKAGPRTELPSQEENRRSHISKSFSHIMDNLQSNIFIAGQRLNDLTGYSGIEALKKEIEGQGRRAPIHHVVSS